MKWFQIGVGGAVAALALGTFAYGAEANEPKPAETIPGMGAIFRVEPDFFETGREQFEAEIERLHQSQSEREASPLTLDPAILPTDASEPVHEFDTPTESAPSDAADSP